MIFRVENEIVKARAHSEDLVLLEVGISDPSEPLNSYGDLSLCKQQGTRQHPQQPGSGKVPRKEQKLGKHEVFSIQTSDHQTIH